MRECMFSGFLLLDSVEPTPGADLGDVEQADSPAVRRSSLERSLQDAIEKLSARFAQGDDTLRGSIVSALESTAHGRSAVLNLTPGMAGSDRGFVREFLNNVIRVGTALEQRRQEEAIAKLAEVMIPDEGGLARGLLAADNLNVRDEFVAKVPCVTSKAIGRSAGHSDTNPHATAARWKKSNEIFSVHHRGVERFPAFQFRDDGRPHPTIKWALAALPSHLSPWQRAFWFVSTNGWLNDAAPADVLDDEGAVVAAAKHEAEPVIG